MPGLYAPSGAINVTVVTGSSFTGRYAPDGSLNVVEAPSSGFIGLYHPCGALYLKAHPGGVTPIYSPQGCYYYSTSNLNGMGLYVNFVSGSFGPSGLYLLEDDVSYYLLENGTDRYALE